MDPLLGLQPNYAFAGERFFGDEEDIEKFEKFFNSDRFQKLPQKAQDAFYNRFANNLEGEGQLVRGILEQTARYSSPEYQQQMLELADKYQTRKGLRQTAFNLFGSGVENLTKGIAMSMNPYGNEQGLQRYLALTASMPQALSSSYQAMRTPMTIPGVQVQSAPTYF